VTIIKVEIMRKERTQEGHLLASLAFDNDPQKSDTPHSTGKTLALGSPSFLTGN
jgi:hypothetical protein